MQTKFGFSVLFLTVALVVSVGRANPGTRSPEASEIERGRYLVEEVAKCGECHTPRNAQGELDRHAWLESGKQIALAVPVALRRCDQRGYAHCEHDDNATK